MHQAGLESGRPLSGLDLPQFLGRLGSKEATPGGGGAAALAGASAAALVTMVARLTAGRPAYADFEERLTGIIGEGDRLRSDLLAAIDADATAFEQVMAAYGLPRKSEEEKDQRQMVLQPALVGATESPLAIARACLKVVQMAAELARKGNPQTITDAGTAATLAEAALQGALFQARINLKSIKDNDYVKNCQTEITALSEQAWQARQSAVEAVNLKLERP